MFRFYKLHRVWFTSIARTCTTSSSTSSSTKTISLLGLGINQGQPHLGPDMSPELLRRQGLLQIIKDNGWLLDEYKDFEEKRYEEAATDNTNWKALNCQSIGLNLREVKKLVQRAASTSNFLLLIGGDHSISMGTIPAIVAERKGCGVVWVVSETIA